MIPFMSASDIGRRQELASQIFDHVSMKFKKGFRMMTLGWTDGCSFIPINFSLLASSKEENILWKDREYDRRSLQESDGSWLKVKGRMS